MHTHIEVNILLCLCCCLNTKSWPPPPPPPALNPKPPTASRGGETQTRTRRVLSAPQPLNTFSALPFENKPHGQAPLSQPPPRRMRATHASRSAGSSAENFPPLLFHGADVRMAAVGRVDVSLGNADAQVVARRGERRACKHLNPVVKSHPIIKFKAPTVQHLHDKCQQKL